VSVACRSLSQLLAAVDRRCPFACWGVIGGTRAILRGGVEEGGRSRERRPLGGQGGGRRAGRITRGVHPCII
jgi:hypothetical protein